MNNDLRYLTFIPHRGALTGFRSPLVISEGFFYGLDTLPLFLAITAYVSFWPIHERRDGARIRRPRK